MTRHGAAALGALLVACAGPRSRPAPPPGGPTEIAIAEPERVEGSAQSELAGKGAEELLATGAAAYAAADDERAVEAFSRAADLLAGSPRRAAALYQAGLACRRLARWRLALERFREVVESDAGPAADEARFLLAEAHWRLGETAEARRVLDALAARSDLDAEHHARALVERGVVEAEDGAIDAAQRSLSLARRDLDAAQARQRLDPALLAKAEYWLGEVARARFLALRLDPATADEARLARDLEAKSELLLAAQDHYARAMRAGDAAFAIAAGGRVGEIYEALYAELTAAPLPPGLGEEGARAYRVELRRRVRVLVAKAIEAYEETLAAAARAPSASELVDQLATSLARMRRVLSEIDVGGVGAPSAGG